MPLAVRLNPHHHHHHWEIDNLFCQPTVTDNNTQLLIVSLYIHRLIFPHLIRGSEWHLEYLQLYRRYHCRIPLRKGREETFIPDFNRWSIFFLSSVVIVVLNRINSFDYIYIGMLVFWTLQTACFALYSTTGNTKAAHTVIAMICTFNSYIKFIHNDVNLLLLSYYWSLVLRILWVHFGFSFFPILFFFLRFPVMLI